MGIEAGALLPLVEVVVAIDFCGWIEFAEVHQKFYQSRLLRQRPRVLTRLLLVWHSRLVLASSDVCHSNRVGVVASLLTVGTYQIDIAPLLNVAITIYHVVIANVAPALPLVVGSNLLNRIVSALGGVGAVDDDFLDGAARLLQA